MQSTSRAPLRIEGPSFKPPSKGLFWLWLCLLSSIILFLGVGFAGPDVFITTESGVEYPLVISEDTDETVTWIGRLTDMTKLHQLIYLEAKVRRPENITANVEFTYQQEIIVTAEGGKKEGGGYHEKIVDEKRHIKTITCKAGEVWCSDISVFATHQVIHDEYLVAVKFVHPGELNSFCPHCTGTGTGVQHFYVHFGMHYINPNFTRWQICWKTLFSFVTILAMFLPCRGGLAGYFWQLRRVLKSNWADIQVWVGVLLTMLLFFNDPMFIIEVFSDYGALLSAVYILFLCAFLATLMFFWLCMLHETSKVGGRIVEGSAPVEIMKGIGFYLPKIIFCAMFWILITVAYVYVRVAQEGDPSYDALEDSMHYKLVTTTVTVAMAIYTGWILYHGLNAMGNVRKLPPQILFTFMFTVLMIILVIVCVGIGATYPLPSASYEFLLFYGLTNVYVWTLAFAYAPLYASSTTLTEKSDGDGIEVGPLSAAAV